MKITNHEVLQILKSGGPRVHEVLDYIYLKSRSKIISYVMKNSGNREDGKDVLQDTIAAFYANIIKNKFRGESDLDGYLFGIARNIWLKLLKARGKAKAFQEAGHQEEDTTEPNIDREIVRQLDATMEKMDNVCRDLLIHAFYFNYPAAELCKKFDFKNEQVARNKKYKCLKKLREMMLKVKNTSE